MNGTSKCAALLTLGTVLLGACTSAPAASDRTFSDACSRIVAPENGDTVVVMRDSSETTRVLGAVPAGVDALGSAVVIAGPAIVTKDGSGIAYSSVDTNVEMRPCRPAQMRDQ